jgi:EAL domain-containing protein (putative c-di-GMP-specific phosphodiesterase class I)
LPNLINDTSQNPVTSALPSTASAGIGAYVGVPLRTTNGDIYGTLCCISTRPEPGLQQRDVDVLTMIGDLIADSVDAKARAHQEQIETRRRIQDVLDAGGPEMVFQPLFAIPEKEVIGYEALARFPAGSGGPDRWFAEASAVGLGRELELAALDQAMKVLDVIPRDLFVSVNLSPAVFLADELLRRIPGQSAGRVVLELTENEEIADYARLRQRISTLRRMGLRLAVDDTGSGYAGMRQLVEIKPDIIKMDYHITHDMHLDPARLAMATALVDFCDRTHAILLAEGVETKEELQAAVKLGIPLAQGYHLSRPLSLEALTASLAAAQ